MRATFPSSARLHRPSEFAAALKGRRIGRGALFVISTPRSRDTAPDTARLGMIIAKRYAAHAVTRNAIKRVIREAFRHQRHRLPARDYVVRLHSKVPDASLSELKRHVRQEIDALLTRTL